MDDYDVQMEKLLQENHSSLTIIEGRLYSPGNRTTGNFRGMAGRRFDIEYLENSIYSGKKITTWDLWAGSELTPDMRTRYADTAKFLNGAGYGQVGSKGCWNSSEGSQEPYPLPREIGIQERN